MRTTIDLDQTVLRRARKLALESNRSLSQLVEEAMRRFLRQPVDLPRTFSLITAGSPDGKAPTWEEIKRGMEAEEEDHWRRVSRGRVADTDAAP